MDILSPTTPATTDQEWMPTRIYKKSKTNNGHLISYYTGYYRPGMDAYTDLQEDKNKQWTSYLLLHWLLQTWNGYQHESTRRVKQTMVILSPTTPATTDRSGCQHGSTRRVKQTMDILSPTTPATTDPEWMPTRIYKKSKTNNGHLISYYTGYYRPRMDANTNLQEDKNNGHLISYYTGYYRPGMDTNTNLQEERNKQWTSYLLLHWLLQTRNGCQHGSTRRVKQTMDILSPTTLATTDPEWMPTRIYNKRETNNGHLISYYTGYYRPGMDANTNLQEDRNKQWTSYLLLHRLLQTRNGCKHESTRREKQTMDILSPTTPATTDPEWMPTRIYKKSKTNNGHLISYYTGYYRP